MRQFSALEGEQMGNEFIRFGLLVIHTQNQHKQKKGKTFKVAVAFLNHRPNGYVQKACSAQAWSLQRSNSCF